MERKTVHALLLSLAVVAGGVMMTTTDAYAQTNTERLITTVDNTNSIIAALEALADAVAEGFAAVLAAIGMVQTGVDEMSGHLEHIEGDLSSIDSDLMAIDEDLMNIHGDLEALDGDLVAIDGDLVDIHGDLEDLHSDLQGIQSDLSTLSSAVGGSSAQFSGLTDAIQQNSVAISSLSEKLEMISTAVGAVKTTVETQEDVDPAVTNMLHSDETEQAVAVADFAGTVTKHPTDNVYKASNTFSCTGDVFVDTISISNPNTILQSIADSGATAKSSITVEGFFLYEAADTSTTTTADNVVLTKTRDFDNRFLRAGDGLMIKGETDQSTSTTALAARAGTAATDLRSENLLVFNSTGTPTYYFNIQEYVSLQSNKATIGPGINQDGPHTSQNATKTNLGTVELYTITVEWFAASSDTTCSISSAVESASGLPNTDRTVLVALNLDETSDEGPPTPFTDATVDCKGEDTEITGVSIQAGAIRGLNQFIDVELSAGGESAGVSFDDDNNADADGSKLPFRFSGSDLTVSGKGIGTLLLQVTYDTTQGNTCTVN